MYAGWHMVSMDKFDRMQCNLWLVRYSNNDKNMSVKPQRLPLHVSQY